MKTHALSVLLLLSGSAYAQDLDLDTDKKKKKKEFTVEVSNDVKEVTKGWYAKSILGGAFYVGSLINYVQPGAVLGLGVGQDFIDQANFSAAWEANFLQGVHNGLYYDMQAADGCAARGACVQGDLRTFVLQASAEASWYPIRRIGIGVRAGAGVPTGAACLVCSSFPLLSALAVGVFTSSSSAKSSSYPSSSSS